MIPVLKHPDRARLLQDVEMHGRRFIGRAEYIRFLQGEHLTYRERILANCYQCTGFYDAGPYDCGSPSCPFHSVSPYKGQEPKPEVTATEDCGNTPPPPENGALVVENAAPARRQRTLTEGRVS